MGRKRKCDSSSNEEIIKKIRRLEKRLKQKRRLRLPSTSSSSSDENERVIHNTRQNEDMEGAAINNEHNTEAASGDVPPAPPECRPSSDAGASGAIPPPPLSPSPPALTAPDQSGNQDDELDESILVMLGDAPAVEMELGPPVHKDIAVRIQNIIQKGLPDELKKKLISECLIPANMENLVPPILNPEIKAALPDTLIKRDYSLLNRQKQLCAALSTLCKSLDILISTKDQKVIKAISDTCRLLSDIFYNETRIRRLFIINAINVQMKNVIVDTTADRYLFGENIADKLRAAQSIKRSGDMLRPVQKTFNKNNFIRAAPKNLNQKGPYRKPAVRAESGRFRQQQRTASTSTAAAPSSSSYRRRGERRSSPTPARARQTYRR